MTQGATPPILALVNFTQANRTICSVQRAAEMLGISPAAVRMRIARGQLPYRRLGARRLVLFEEEILRFIDESPGLRPEAALGNSRSLETVEISENRFVQSSNIAEPK